MARPLMHASDILPAVALGAVALVVAVVVGRRLWRTTAGPTADRLIQNSETLAVAAPLRDQQGGQHHGLFVAQLGATDDGRAPLVAALGEHGGLRAMLEQTVAEAVAPWASARCASDCLDLQRAVAPELTAAVSKALARRGIDLEGLTAHCVTLTPELKRLDRVWISRCTRGAPAGLRTSVHGLELYLDGLSGHGDIYASTAQRAGGVVSKAQSTEILANPALRVRYTIGRPSGLLHSDAFGDLMSGAAEVDG